MIYHVEADEFIKKLVSATFPGYTGRKYKLHVSDAPINCASYWDGGSRSYFRFINLASLEASQQLPAQSAFDTKIAGIDAVLVPPGFACIEHSIFMGKDGGITIHIPPENAANLLPAPIILTQFEKIVLVATRGLKSSYNGIKDYRYQESHIQTGITHDEWCDAVMALMNRGLLSRAGAITPKGMNAIANEQSLMALKITRTNGGS